MYILKHMYEYFLQAKYISHALYMQRALANTISAMWADDYLSCHLRDYSVPSARTSKAPVCESSMAISMRFLA